MSGRTRLARIITVDIKTCWKQPNFSAFSYVRSLNDKQVQEALIASKEELSVDPNLKKKRENNRQILIHYLIKKNQEYLTTIKRSGNERKNISEDPTVLAKQIKSIENEMLELENFDAEYAGKVSDEEQKYLWHSSITSNDKAEDLMERYESFKNHHVEGKLLEDDYYKKRHERRISEGGVLKEKFPIDNNSFPLALFPNFSSALDNVFDNLAAINLYQNSTLNDMFNHLKTVETELNEKIAKLEG